MEAAKASAAGGGAEEGLGGRELGAFMHAVAGLVRRDGPDLSARQLAVLLTCYLFEGPHTVRGLASGLRVAKPAVSRALDRLEELDLARRQTDPADRRSVVVRRTVRGSALLREIREMIAEGQRAFGGVAASA